MLRVYVYQIELYVCMLPAEGGATGGCERVRVFVERERESGTVSTRTGSRTTCRVFTRHSTHLQQFVHVNNVHRPIVQDAHEHVQEEFGE